MFSNDDDSTVQSQWCEVSLGTDSEQEVRGRLRFRKDSLNSSETDSVESDRSENDVAGTASVLLSDKNNDIKRSNESLAYQYGMKMLWGAAKVVSTVADGGKQNRQMIKTLREDLEQINKKYNCLQKELENSKQWIAYYENMKEGLECQVEENKKRYAADVNVMQEKIQRYEDELGYCRKQLAEAVTSRDNLLSDVQNAQASVAKLKSQVEKAQKMMTEHVKTSRTAAKYKSTTTVAVQVQLDSSPNPESRSLVELKKELKKKEHTLQNALSASQLAESARDQLRHRLMTSLSEMKSQAMVMRSIRVAYDAVTCEKRCLREELRHKQREHEDALRKLETERELRHEKSSELREKNNLLNEAMEANTELQRQQLVHNEKVFKQRKEAIDKIKTKHMAEVIVDSVINEALAIQQKSLQCKVIETFQNQTLKLIEQLNASEEVNQKLRNEILSLQDDLHHKNSLLEQNYSQIHKLAEENNQYRNGLAIKEKNVQQLLEALSLSQEKTFQIFQKCQSDINAKRSEISDLHLQVQTLKQENVDLQFKVQQISVQTVKADASAQTNIRNQDIDQLRCDLNTELKRNDSMRLQAQSAEQKSIDRENELLAQIKALQTNVSNLTKDNNHLNDALSRERKDSHTNHSQYCAQYEKYCKDLEWQYQLRNRDARQLYQENLELRQYIEKWNSNLYCAGYNKHRSYSTLPCNQYFTSQRQYEHYQNMQQYLHNHRDSGKRYYAQPLESITEKEEYSPTKSHVSSPLPKPTSSSPVSSNEASKKSTVPSLNLHQPTATQTDITKMNKSSKGSSEKTSKSHVCRAHCLSDSGVNTASSLQTVKTSKSSVESDENTLTIQLPQSPPQRLFGIPMSEDVYKRILAGEDVPDWQADVVIAPDDGYSSISCDSFPSEMFFRQSNNVDKITHSAAIFEPKSTEENLHYYVTYKGVEFDMIGLSVSQIRNITTACGAIGSQSEMNAFYDFLAAKTREIREDPCWSGYDKLESPEDWLSLKQEAFV